MHEEPEPESRVLSVGVFLWILAPYLTKFSRKPRKTPNDYVDKHDRDSIWHLSPSSFESRTSQPLVRLTLFRISLDFFFLFYAKWYRLYNMYFFFFIRRKKKKKKSIVNKVKYILKICNFSPNIIEAKPKKKVAHFLTLHLNIKLSRFTE